MSKQITATTTSPKRGEVWFVNFDPSVGAEIQKYRPAVVMSLDSVGRLPLRIIVPITDWKPYYANAQWIVQLRADNTNGLKKLSGADVFQTKSVSINRFVRFLGYTTAQQVEDIATAIKLCVGAP